MSQANARKTERFHVCMEKETVDALDEYGFANRIKTRAEVVRHLIRQGLHNQNKTEKGEAAA